MRMKKEDKNKIYQLLELIYPDKSKEILDNIINNIDNDISSDYLGNEFKDWDQKTCVLITYADSIYEEEKKTLKSLHEFLIDNLKDFIDTVHILPFLPSSSDDGFAVTDFFEVDSKYGDWKDIKKISIDFNIMSDVILNHASKSNKIFKKYLLDKKEYQNFFLSVSDNFDTSKVVRPREHNLIQNIHTDYGIKKLWCTFSDDQIDFNFLNHKVLEFFLNVISNFIKNGVRIIRLDAVGFLWKESGTSCVNLKQTHSIIKLIRLICDLHNKNIKIVTETNLPNQENLSYFGNGNEAHWIYNFPLPPLIINSILFADSTILRNWSMSMPPALEGMSYLNFISSHDGFGMRPTEGLLDDEQRSKLFERLEKNGSYFSYKTNTDGTKSVYEVNSSLYNALEKTDLDQKGKFKIERCVLAYAIILGIEGIPAIYLNSLIGDENDYKDSNKSNIKRRINRRKFNKKLLVEKINNSKTKEFKILNSLKKLILKRSQHSAFHPNATQFTLQLGPEMFGVWRQNKKRTQSIFVINNLQPKIIQLNLSEINLIATESWYDIITETQIDIHNNKLYLDPYQTVWITNK